MFLAGMVLGCKMGWLPFRNSCYKIFQSPTTWQEANTKCGQNAAKLASILDRHENDFIEGNLPKRRTHLFTFYIRAQLN